jgi:hypothetical protein
LGGNILGSRRLPLREALVEALGISAPGEPSAFLGAVTEALRERHATPWLGLFVSRGAEVQRIGVAVGEARTRRVPADLCVEMSVPEEAIPSVAAASQIREDSGSQPGWIRFPGGQVWGFAATPDDLVRSTRNDLSVARALEGAVAMAGSMLLSSRETEARHVKDQVERIVVRATWDTRAAVDLFLRVALTGLAGERGLVAVIHPSTGRRTVWSVCGDMSAQANGIVVERLGGEWIATVTDPGSVASGAKAIYAVARGCRQGVVVLVVASAAGARSLSERTVVRVEHAVGALCALLDADQDVVRARSRMGALVDGIVALVDADVASSPSHHEQVTAEALHAGRCLGLDRETLRDLERAARVHDVGLVGVASESLGSAMEFLHPSTGAALLEALGESPRVVALVRTHHERADGLGFPKGKSPRADDFATWALIAAEAIVERAARCSLDVSVARKEWLSQDGRRVLPAAVVALLAR